MSAYFDVEDKYGMENTRIREMNMVPDLSVHDINAFIAKCSSYPLFKALNPTMLIICNQLSLILQEKNINLQNPVDLKKFFKGYLPQIKRIFKTKTVKDEKLLQDIIVYSSHLNLINNDTNVEEEIDDLEYESETEYPDNAYVDDIEEDTGGDYF